MGEKTGKAALALGLTAAAVTGGAVTEAAHRVVDDSPTTYFVNGETVNSPTQAAEQQITTDISLGHHIDVAEGVTAVVQFESGSQLNIENPIVTHAHPSGEPDSEGIPVVAERARSSDGGEINAVYTYSNGEDGVTGILYFDEDHPDGVEALDWTEFGQVDSMPIVRSPGTSTSGSAEPVIPETPNNFFIPGPEADPAFNGLHIGQGTFYPAQHGEQ